MIHYVTLPRLAAAFSVCRSAARALPAACRATTRASRHRCAHSLRTTNYACVAPIRTALPAAHYTRASPALSYRLYASCRLISCNLLPLSPHTSGLTTLSPAPLPYHRRTLTPLPPLHTPYPPTTTATACRATTMPPPPPFSLPPAIPHLRSPAACHTYHSQHHAYLLLNNARWHRTFLLSHRVLRGE